MSKYTSHSQRKSIPKPEQPHPVWRGIGCLMIVIVPIISFALSLMTTNIAVQQNWPLPSQLTGYPVMPSFLWYLQGLTPVLIAIQGVNNLYLLIALTIIFTVILGAVISFGYAIIYRLAGPPRLSPLDAERPNIKVKRYKR